MTRLEIIDLRSSPEREDSPTKAADAALAQFQPHTHRRTGTALKAQCHGWIGRGESGGQHSCSTSNGTTNTDHGNAHSKDPIILDHRRTDESTNPASGSSPTWLAKNAVGIHPHPAKQDSLASLLAKRSGQTYRSPQQEPKSSNQPQLEPQSRPVGQANTSAAYGRFRIHSYGKVPYANALAGQGTALSSQSVSQLQNRQQSGQAMGQRLYNVFKPIQVPSTTRTVPLNRSVRLDSGTQPKSDNRHEMYTSNDTVPLTPNAHTSSQLPIPNTRLNGVASPMLGERTDFDYEAGNQQSLCNGHQHPSGENIRSPQAGAGVQDDRRPGPLVVSRKPSKQQVSKPWSPEEDALLKKLKEVDQLPWDQITLHLPGRTRGAIQFRYSTKLKANRKRKRADDVVTSPERGRSQTPDPTLRPKRSRKPAVTSTDGFVSWQEIQHARRNGKPIASATDLIPEWRGAAEPEESDIDFDSFVENEGECSDEEAPNPLSKQDRVFPRSTSCLLRQRELGNLGGRAWTSQAKPVSEELKEHAFSSYVLTRYHHGTSGDVLSVSWSPNDNRFAIGSAAISDQMSMQYNMSRNLLIGDAHEQKLRELTEHHEARPLVADSRNVNALHAMRESQDPRLFVTVTATGFSQDGKRLYTTGKDRQLRMYSTNVSLNDVKCQYAIGHTAAVDVMSVGHGGLVATGCHSPDKSINVYSCGETDFAHSLSLSPTEDDSETHIPLHPAALKWGLAYQHRNFLLAGFSNHSIVDDVEDLTGATCIWDVQAGKRIPFRATTYDVSDVAWNPLPSPASISFAVASSPHGIQVNKGVRTVVQCFAPNQDAVRRVFAWQCPASDINDIVFCPYDSNLIACGATDGRVYIWDQRFVDRSQKPLHTLSHGESLTVLPHDSKREHTDTGVRFISWGACRTRLYSGSSDGIVKVWNPYRSPSNTEVEEFTAPRHQRSAIMAGSFSNDWGDLLIGTETGYVNIFSVRHRGHGRPAETLRLQASSPGPVEQSTDPFAESKSLLRSGHVELRPCGALPIRQAVQGPDYRSPSANLAGDIAQAQSAYQLALNARDGLNRENDDYEDDFGKASNRVRETCTALKDQQERLLFLASCQSKAQAHQRALAAAEEARAALETAFPDLAVPCKLDCGYFETTAELAADSGDSEMRIPGLLGLIQKSAGTEPVAEDNIKTPVTAEACPSCSSASAGPKQSAQCARCRLKQAGLTAKCTKCSAPARPSTDKNYPTLCAKCSFACFRCGQPADVSAETGLVSCTHCKCVWEAGSLGYEAIPHAARKSLIKDQRKAATPDRDIDINSDGDDCNGKELGAEEIEHYASRWSSQNIRSED